MNINHTTIEKNDSTLSVTNHQAVATGYIGATLALEIVVW